ncbi:hypothetical protein BJV78DRAFT_1282227 [Lactifluus subvellereus]|nr:hypothetical protein BJV78DRAFT_1282227 [Lactifluus subvellereus]
MAQPELLPNFFHLMQHLMGVTTEVSKLLNMSTIAGLDQVMGQLQQINGQLEEMRRDIREMKTILPTQLWNAGSSSMTGKNG